MTALPLTDFVSLDIPPLPCLALDGLYHFWGVADHRYEPGAVMPGAYL